MACSSIEQMPKLDDVNILLGGLLVVRQVYVLSANRIGVDLTLEDAHHPHMGRVNGPLSLVLLTHKSSE